MKWIKILGFLIPFLSLFFPLISFSRDTDIYMASGEGVQPNILIIFDNSASMNDEIPTRQYNKDTTYPGSALRDKVYRYSSGNWVLFGPTADQSDIEDIPAACTTARDTLINYNFATGVYTALNNGICNRNRRDLRTGNYVNYMSSGGDIPRTKLNIAKDTVKDLIDTVGDAKMGIMLFNANVTDNSPHGKGWAWSGNNSHGGYIPSGGGVESLTGSKRTTLKNIVTNITANTFTPLAETLYEAGLYFKGAASYFNNGVSYVGLSPIEYSCQKNYVIIMTDGNPTRDDGYSPYDNTPEDPPEPTNPSSYDYLHPKEHNHILKRVVGDRDGDKQEPGMENEVIYDQITETITGQDWWGTDYLDDVAKYLHDTDLRGDLTGTQNIITYTIGFKIVPQHNLLGRTADADHGGGKYYVANDAAELADAFQHIVGEIMEQTSSFVAPIVPVSRMEKTTAGDKLYLALFQPYQNKMWSGNIKRFGVVQSGPNIGQLIDINNSLSLESDGQIKNSATSHWPTDVPDGRDVEKGGVGKKLKNRSSARNIYTYLGASDLTADSNKFNTTNITRMMLGVLTDDERDNIVKFVHGYDVYYENESDPKGPTVKRDWILGSFIHSRPIVIHYGEFQPSYIFAGANDGMLHAFNDDSGEEEWAFIPPNLLKELQALHADVNATFVDGSPKAYIVRNSDGSMNRAILIFGQRRGGNRYYALDVTTPSSPQYLWEINPDATGSPYAEIGTTDPVTGRTGQTWSYPNIGKIACQGGAPHCIGGERWVAFINGGYDTNQDNNPVTTADSMGRAVYVVDVLDGSLVRRFSYSDPGYSTMTYSIPSDVARVDTDGDGKINRLYVGDMGGRMWRFDISDPDPVNWTGRIIFESNPGNDSTTGRKIFYPPDVTLERGDYEMLIFGTGDREHPQEEAVINRLYVVKDKNLIGTILNENNLYDLTVDELQTDITEARRNEILSQLNAAYGWLIKLGTGEKSLSTPIVFYKTAYFTTFSPLGGGDPCYATFGTARMYALDYRTGNAVFNLDLSNDIGGIKLRRSDRSEIIGTAIPSGVIITFVQGTGVAYTGVGGGVDMPPLPITKSLVPISWRIVF
jgi:type IV pilus assembly protein PilY1